MNSTNILAIIPLLQALCSQPTNSLPVPVTVPIGSTTNTIVSTNWVLTADWKVEHGVRSQKWVMDSVSTNVEREEVTALILFRTNPVLLSASRVTLAGDTNAPTKWEPYAPPLPVPGQFTKP